MAMEKLNEKDEKALSLYEEVNDLYNDCLVSAKKIFLYMTEYGLSLRMLSLLVKDVRRARICKCLRNKLIQKFKAVEEYDHQLEMQQTA